MRKGDGLDAKLFSDLLEVACRTRKATRLSFILLPRETSADDKFQIVYPGSTSTQHELEMAKDVFEKIAFEKRLCVSMQRGKSQDRFDVVNIFYVTLWK